jgi:hypothetical protein
MNLNNQFVIFLIDLNQLDVIDQDAGNEPFAIGRTLQRNRYPRIHAFASWGWRRCFYSIPAAVRLKS